MYEGGCIGMTYKTMSVTLDASQQQIAGVRQTNKNAKKSPLILISTKSRLVSYKMGLLCYENYNHLSGFFALAGLA